MLLKLAFTMLFALTVSTVFAQNTNTATTQLYALFDAEWELNLRENPTFASFLGDKRYNDRWDDVSLTTIEKHHQHRVGAGVTLSADRDPDGLFVQCVAAGHGLGRLVDALVCSPATGQRDG